jgi:uncharacterized protein YaiE (UPF0345 family)
MSQSNTSTISRSFSQDGRQQKMGDGSAQIIDLDTHHIAKVELPGGFRYSEANGQQTQHPRIGYVVQGSLTVRDDQGQESTVGQDQVFHIPAGSDFWTDQKVSMIDYTCDTQH